MLICAFKLSAMVLNVKTPGVYIDEINAFGNSVVPVATAVPAFIGYTPTASYGGKSYLNKPVKITSFNDFEAYFLNQNKPGQSQEQQYSPQYYLEESINGTINLDNGNYELKLDPNSIYYLYNSVRLFYENGGGDAYIVSVGSYESLSGTSESLDNSIVNENIELAALQNGLSLLKNEEEPTMYICPESTLLSVADNGTLMEQMLLHASEMQTAICLFDPIGGRCPKEADYEQSIQQFRNNTGDQGLKYGTAYFPFVNTTISNYSDLDYTNFFGGDTSKLEAVINPASNPNDTITSLFKSINDPNSRITPVQNNNALLNISKDYKTLYTAALHQINTLPASGAMAGVMTAVDNTQGVWTAPANRNIIGAAAIPLNINDTQQQDLNVDAVSGKSVNAIRFFNGQGVKVWGARTLDGNSTDWKYVNVRRTITFIEQSVKLAARAYVFQANDSNTWKGVQSMIESFLNGIWQEGALQGSKATDAYSVSVGLGSTMTANDISQGYMNVNVQVAITHPAEFITITFEQEQAKS